MKVMGAKRIMIYAKREDKKSQCYTSNTFISRSRLPLKKIPLQVLELGSSNRKHM